MLRRSLSLWVLLASSHSFTLSTTTSTAGRRRIPPLTKLLSSSSSNFPNDVSIAAAAVTPVDNKGLEDGKQLTKLQARLLLVSCAMTYGYGYVNTKGLQQMLAPSIVTTLRFLLGSLIFLPSILRNWRSSSRAALKGGVELGALCAAGFIAQGISLQTTPASKVAFFCGLSVIMPPIFTMISAKSISAASKDRKSSRHFLQSPLIPPGLALIGAAILEWGSFDAPQISDLFLLVTPISFALCFWRAEKLSRKVPAATALITGLMLSTCAFISAIFAIGTGAFPLTLASLSQIATKLNTRQAMLSLLYTGGLATALTSYIEQRAIKVLSAADTTLIYSLEPIFASIFASLFLREHLSASSCISAVFIITACLYDEMTLRILKRWPRTEKR